MKRIEATAYHEAGHAVCNLSLGRAFQYVTIKPNEDTLGHCMGLVYRGGQRLAMDMYENNGRARDWIERRVKVLLAGNIAERRFVGRNVVAGSQSDFHSAIDMLSNLCGQETEEISIYFDLMFIRTRALLTVPHTWLTVERLAAELLNKQTLQYKAAKEIANQAREDFLRLPRKEQQRMREEGAAYRQQQVKKGGAAK